MIAFKEWTLICAALGRGEQSIIIRKGGIAEGREGFRFKHPEFLLFPTLFHEQLSKLRVAPDTRVPDPREDGHHCVEFSARVEWVEDVADWERVSRLAPFHLWTVAEIEKRFLQDDENRVTVAFVRVFRLDRPLIFPDAPEYGGCRSWIELPELPPRTGISTVLPEAEHDARSAEVKALLQP